MIRELHLDGPPTTSDLRPAALQTVRPPVQTSSEPFTDNEEHRMKPQWQMQMTLPEKDRPYTQHDMDIVIGHPVKLTMGATTGTMSVPLLMTGVITAAEIQPDGSAVVTMDVS